MVTGASSGFGLRTAVMLAKRGWIVYAGLRDPSAVGELRKEAEESGADGRLRIVRLDVTDEGQIVEVARRVETEGGRLDALVNNAGYAAGGFVEELPIRVWREQFETNLFGAVAVTRAMLPQMRRTPNSRIVLVGSVSGRIGFPGMAPYCASKHALEGFGEALRLELAGFGMGVSIVEPGPYRTPIWRKSMAALQAPAPDSPYAALFRNMQPMLEKSASGGGDPERVAAAICRALEDKRPKLRYLPGSGERMTIAAKQLLPWSWIEKAALRMLGVKR